MVVADHKWDGLMPNISANLFDMAFEDQRTRTEWLTPPGFSLDSCGILVGVGTGIELFDQVCPYWLEETEALGTNCRLLVFNVCDPDIARLFVKLWWNLTSNDSDDGMKIRVAGARQAPHHGKRLTNMGDRTVYTIEWCLQ